MKKTILIICVAAACILFGLVAFIGLSGRNKNEEQQYRFYYINSDETRLKEEKYTPEKETTEVMLRNFSESLNNRETREDGISLFPDGVKISSYSIQDGVLNVEFNEAYDKMSRTRELLVRAGIVKIFLQVPGVDSVEIYVGKKPLTDTRGEEVGAMNNDTFVEFSGSDGDVYSYDTFTLYFTNKNGDKLVAEQRSVRYRRNLPKATVVLEQLARGPLEKGHYPTIPENSEVLSLTRANGICYVDYNSVFQDTGEELGMSFSYKIQEQPNGLAQAFVLGADFLNGEPGCLILGDNMFYGQGFSAMLRRAANIEKGACIYGYYVKDPRAYGVVEFDEQGKVISLEEKPEVPKSNYAVPGLYFYDASVTEKAAALRPSARGEYEITDLNRLYLEEGTLKVELFGRGFAWLDTGNCDSLLEASNFVATIQNRQGFYVSCIEEIAWRQGWIPTEQLLLLGQQLEKTEYGKYLIELAKQS